MKTSSPLRYPGGKSVLFGLLRSLRQINGLGEMAIAEPFAGGAGASLSLLYKEEVPKVYINDVDAAIFDFWWALTAKPAEFGKLIDEAKLNMAEWRRQRDIYRSSCRMTRLARGFATFYLNRCNRSGIIVNGGPIGGVRQKGRWKLAARFNRAALTARCSRVAEYRDRIVVSCDDGLKFIKRLESSNTFFFIDPPYFEKGPTLYLNALDSEYHARLADLLRSTNAAWALTYDDCPEVRKLYRGWATIRPFSLQYAAATRRKGNELLIAPKYMRLPKTNVSDSISF